MAGGTEFNSAKFKELVLLFAQRSKDDPRMSRVKLNKLLYRADFEAFRLLGQSITGATYIKGEYGPMAEQLPLAEKELGDAGYMHYRTDESGPYPRKIPLADEAADARQFSEDERSIIDQALQELAPHGGKGASTWSHEQSAGWNTVEMDEAIPYGSAFVSTEPLTEKERERALQRSRDEGWASIRP